MAPKRIKRIIDALGSQGRFILQLECGHNMSVTSADLTIHPSLLVVAQACNTFNCTVCPDPPPPIPKEENPMEAFYIASAGEPKE